MADGTFRAAETDRHPNPITEAIRWQIAEGQLVQIIGRARGVNRTPNNAVDILVMTNAPLPIPAERLITAARGWPENKLRSLQMSALAHIGVR